MKAVSQDEKSATLGLHVDGKSYDVDWATKASLCGRSSKVQDAA